MNDARIIHTQDKTVVEFKIPLLPIWLTVYENRGNFYSAEIWLQDHLNEIKGRRFSPSYKTVKYY